MADAKLSALTAKEATVFNPFSDLLYFVNSAGATDADKQRKATPGDIIFDYRNSSWGFADFQFSQDQYFGQGTSGSGASIGSSSAAAGNHPGVYSHETGTDTTGQAQTQTNNAYGFQTGGGQMRLVFGVKTGGSLSDGTNRYTLAMGLADGTAHAPSNCVFVRYRDDVNGGKWQLVCRAGGSESVADIGVTVVADTWYRIVIDINAAGDGVVATVNGTPSGTVTTNIPSNQMYLVAMAIIKSLGTTSRDAHLDYCGWLQHFTTAR